MSSQSPPSLFSEINNYRQMVDQLEEITRKDSNAYKKAAIVCFVLSVPALIFVWFLGLLLLFAGLFCLYYWKKNAQGIGQLYFSKIRHKEHWSKKHHPEGQKDPTIYHTYLFEVEVQKAFELDIHEPSSLNENGKRKEIIVNEQIYQLFNVQDDFHHVMTPSGDLMGYAYEGNMELLLLEKELSNGEKRAISVSIPQTHFKKNDWNKVAN